MTLGYKLLAALILLVASIWGFNAFTEHLVRRGDGQGYKRAQSEYQQRENEALNKALADKARLEKELQGVSDDARQKIASASADAAAAAAAAARLRDALAAARRAPSVCPLPAPGGGAPANPSERVLADVQRRLDEAADRVAEFADRAHIAGLACERADGAMK